MRSLVLSLIGSLLLSSLSVTDAFAPTARQATVARPIKTTTSLASTLKEKTTSSSKKKDDASESSFEETTKKFGLEAGLFESIKKKDGESAKSLLKKYGIAYLATSIPLALISFTLCYVLVDNGVDVANLLAKVGIETSAGTAETTAGTFALAYAAHKAASPIRFPPTVLLTPVVAKWIGKEPNAEEGEGDE